MLKLAWKAPPEQYPPLEMLDYAIAAEKAGFDALEASDHFHPWSDDGQASFVWTWLGAVAARTSKIEMGTGITCPILRYHPAIIAQAAATLATMAPNRAFLAVGTGEALNEYAAVGKWPGYNERQQMLTEAIQLIRELWTGEETSFAGTYYQTKKARLYTYPPQPIPLYISTLVPESATFAGQFGDGLITVGGEEDDTYKQILKSFEQGARQAGRNPSKAVKMIEINVAYTEDEQGAIEMHKKYWAGTMIPALFDQKIYTPKDSAKNGKTVGNDTIKQKVCISADPETHIQNAQRYIDLGFNYIIFHSPGPDQAAFITGYGRDVLPHLREGKDHATHFQQDNLTTSTATQVQ